MKQSCGPLRMNSESKKSSFEDSQFAEDVAGTKKLTEV